MFAPAAAASAILRSARWTFASFDATHDICTSATVTWSGGVDRGEPGAFIAYDVS